MATQVFLLTDIEGSTRRWAAEPAAMLRALERHDELVAAAVAGAGGSVFKHTGDGMFAVFPSAGAAVAGAVAAQHALMDEASASVGGVRVRMAVHAGEAERRGDDWFGPALNRTARLAGLAHGGQVLVSDVVRGLLADLPLGPVGLVDLGVHRLRDLRTAERVWQVVAPGLERSFPPIRSGNFGNLPEQVTSFVGRCPDRDRLTDTVLGHRLVSVTGTGGIGKTRLALAAGAALVDKFPDGVWFVPLAALSQPEALDAAVIGALGELPVPEMNAREVALTALAPRRALLIVDNCEHLLEGAADLAGDVLSYCPNVHVLTTTRQALSVPGEWAFPLAPLSPNDQVELFSDRAAAVRPGARLDRERVADVCARLDGLPLAIELAAARLRSMSLAELAERLDERFRLLAAGRGVEPRHRTLQAVVDWSFSQLTTTEQAFFCRLSVFAGPFDLRAAAAVAADNELAALDLLDALVDRSLVVLSERDEQASYQLLVTLRQYGRARLDAADLSATTRRHVEHYAAIVADGIRSLRDGDDDNALTGLARSWDNLREAVHATMDTLDADLALRLVTPLAAYVNLRPDPEVAAWASAALALPDAGRHRLALWAHLLLSQVAWPQLELDAAERHARQALAIIEEQGIRPFPRPYLALAFAVEFQGRFSEALPAFRRAADLARGQGRTMDLLEALHNAVTSQIFAGNRWADEDIDELLEVAGHAQSARASAIAYSAVGLAALVDGRADAASLLGEAANLAAGRLKAVEGPFRGWARIARAAESPPGELAGLAEELAVYDLSKLPFAFRVGLRTYSRALSTLGRHRAVALIEGAGAAASVFPRDSQRAAERAREALGPAEFEHLVDQGRRMKTEEVARLMRSELDSLGVHA